MAFIFAKIINVVTNMDSVIQVVIIVIQELKMKIFHWKTKYMFKIILLI